MYTATLTSFGKKYSGSGKTAVEAIAKIEVTGVARGKSVLSVSNGKNSKDRILPPVMTSRLFSKSPLNREVALKNTSLLFDGV